MSKVAFLGLGAMGSRMASNLLKAGLELTVWNLSPEAANKLAASGAKAAATPREAAEGNDFVIAMVSNDEASRHVWLDRSNGALAGAKAGAIAIERSFSKVGYQHVDGRSVDDSRGIGWNAEEAGRRPKAGARCGVGDSDVESSPYP
jgi:3-hydroxyisobutyrate dehydrogenase